MQLTSRFNAQYSVDCIRLEEQKQVLGYYELRDGVHLGGIDILAQGETQRILAEPVLDLTLRQGQLFAVTRAGNLVTQQGIVNVTSNVLFYLDVHQDGITTVDDKGCIHQVIGAKCFTNKLTEYSLWACRHLSPAVTICGGDQPGLIVFDCRTIKTARVFKTIEGVCDLRVEQNRILAGTFGSAFYGIDLRMDIPLFKQNMEGGTWRIIRHNRHKDWYLVGQYDKHCFAVIKEQQASKFQAVMKIYGESLAYSCDWFDQKAMTSTFYNREVSRWFVDWSKLMS